jgi:hypothetical protein
MRNVAGDLLAFGGIAIMGVGVAMIHKPSALILVGAMYYITAMLPYLRNPK